MFSVSILDIKTALPILQDTISQAVLPGEDGQLCIMDFHQPIVSCLKKGLLRIDDKSIAINNGIARMYADKLVILVER